jgi:hypothetical protein
MTETWVVKCRRWYISGVMPSGPSFIYDTTRRQRRAQRFSRSAARAYAKALACLFPGPWRAVRLVKKETP